MIRDRQRVRRSESHPDGQAAKVNVIPAKFVVRFDEPVSGFAAADVSVSGTSNPSEASVSGTGAEYIVTVDKVEGDGTIVLDVIEGAVADAIGNRSTTVIEANTVTLANPGGVIPAAGNREFPLREALLLIVAGLLLLLVSRRRRRRSTLPPRIATDSLR